MKSGSWPRRPVSCKSFKMPIFQVVSYAFSRSKKIAVACCVKKGEMTDRLEPSAATEVFSPLGVMRLMLSVNRKKPLNVTQMTPSHFLSLAALQSQLNLA